MTAVPALAVHARLAELEGGCTTAEALALFDDLPPVTVEQVLGDWRGGEVPTGHRLDGLLALSGWHGKRFRGPEDVDPLVMSGGWALDPALVPLRLLMNARPLVTAAAPLLRPLLPLARTRRPRARLRAVEHRGVSTAAMVYDALPVLDVFRAVDDDTLLGMMDLRWDPSPYAFVLRREV